MKTITNMIKMDLAICRKTMLIMIVSMIIAGVVCLFYFTPLLLSLFVVGATAVVSTIFAVENKSNMEFFYGCLPIQKSQYVISRSLTCLLVLAIPSIISLIFTQLGIHFSLCRNEDIELIMELAGQYQMPILCSMIMLGLMGGANLLLVSFAGKLESREMMEVLLLLGEGLIIGAILFVIKEFSFNGDEQKFYDAFIKMISKHETASCILLVCIGIMFLFICSLISIKIMKTRTVLKS